MTYVLLRRVSFLAFVQSSAVLFVFNMFVILTHVILRYSTLTPHFDIPSCRLHSSRPKPAQDTPESLDMEDGDCIVRRAFCRSWY